MHVHSPEELLSMLRALPPDVRRGILDRATEQLEEDSPKPAAVAATKKPSQALEGWEAFVTSLPSAPALPHAAFDRGNLYDR